MKLPLFNDRRSSSLLDRVRDDVSRLRDDIGNLMSHTTRETLPNSARELADQAKHQLAAGSAYAASRFRGLTRQPPPRHSAEWVGGAIVAGLLAYGVYVLLRNSDQASNGYNDPESDET